MKIKFPSIQLLMIGLSACFATSCDVIDDQTPKKIEETAFFTAKFNKTQVWEVTIEDFEGEFEVGKTMTLNVQGPARTLYTMQHESQPVNWGSASDRYLQFKIEKGGSYSQIIDDIANDEPTYIIPLLYEKNGTLAEDYDSNLDPCSVVGRGADGFVAFFHCSEEVYFMYFSNKPLTNPATISFKPTHGEVNKLSELTDEKVETQLDNLNEVLPTAGGVSTVVFKPGATYGTMTDLNGNTYKTITIGTQTWMAENLRTTKYRNGASINIVNIDYEWTEQTTGACCSSFNTTDKNLIATEGLLYNAFAINDSRKIAPAGWHVPTEQEWEKLITYLGGDENAGGKMKETGTKHWSESSALVTNESGFSAIPAGGRNNEDGNFYRSQGISTYFGSSTINPENVDCIWVYGIYFDANNTYKSYSSNTTGMSVRLIKD